MPRPGRKRSRGVERRIPTATRLVRGRFTGGRTGDGWIVPAAGMADAGEDLHITRSRLGGALPGDVVEAEVRFRSRRGRLEGEVVRVLDRGAHLVVGQLTRERTIVVWDRQWSRELRLAPGRSGRGRPGDLVSVRIRRFPSPHRPALGEVEAVFGAATDPSAELKAILSRYGIRDEFPEDALRQAAAAPAAVRSNDLAGREDFRSRLILTLDPADAKDHDDAIEAVRIPGGGYRIGVHIADVSHYVPAGSPVDREAALRGNSVYFPERAAPMLPEALSSGICSLVEGRDRLTRSVELEIGADGGLRRARVVRAVIASAARLSYAEGARLLSGVQRGAVADAVRTMGAAAALLGRARRRRGAVDLDLPEPRLECDEQGNLTWARYAERTDAHRLVEEFMLLANQAVAERFRRSGAPALHRIHAAPAEARVHRFEDLLGAFGERLRAPSEGLRPVHFARLADRSRKRPEALFLMRRMLRAMKPAEYSPRMSGHFALALPDYTHFTSPIRRYPDLVVHRALDPPPNDAAGAGPEADLADLARTCSATERAAEAAERTLIERRIARWLRGRLGDVFAARIAETGRFGLIVELDETPARGLVPLAALSGERFRFQRRDFSLRSRASGRSLRIGDRVEAQLVRVAPLGEGLEFRLV